MELFAFCFLVLPFCLQPFFLPGVHVEHYGYALLVAASDFPGQYYCKTNSGDFYNSNYYFYAWVCFYW